MVTQQSLGEGEAANQSNNPSTALRFGHIAEWMPSHSPLGAGRGHLNQSALERSRLQTFFSLPMTQ